MSLLRSLFQDDVGTRFTRIVSFRNVVVSRRVECVLRVIQVQIIQMISTW